MTKAGLEKQLHRIVSGAASSDSPGEKTRETGRRRVVDATARIVAAFEDLEARNAVLRNRLLKLDHERSRGARKRPS